MYGHWLLSVKAIEVAFYKDTIVTEVGNQTSIYFGIVAAISGSIDIKSEDLSRQHSSSSTDQTLFQTQAKPRRGAGRGGAGEGLLEHGATQPRQCWIFRQ